MELNEKHIDQIGAYLQGRLEGEELASFLVEVDQNASLKEELKIQQAIHDGIEHKSNKEIKARLNKISAERKETKRPTKIISMPLVKIVSSIAAIALLCFVAYFLLDKSSDSDTLFAQYFEPSELTITRSTDIEADLVTLKELYNTHQYKNALPLFKNIISNDPTASNLRLAYGNTLLKCNKIKEAREQFKYIIDSNDPLYSDQSRWYFSLLELKEGNVDKAKEMLSILVNDSNSDFHTEAQSLLQDLNDIR